MQIRDVEQQVGITKKNIRFYEKEGLLKPGRNTNNDYREYSAEDVATLKVIKLLRKLDVTVEDIRLVLNRKQELSVVLARHARKLAEGRANLEAAEGLCRELAHQQVDIRELQADLYLEKMDRKEKEGVSFMDFQEKDRRKRTVGAIIAGVVMILVFVAMVWLMVWAMVESEAPWFMVVIFGGMFAVFAISIAIALFLRLKEIKGGEEYEARKY